MFDIAHVVEPLYFSSSKYNLSTDLTTVSNFNE